VSGLGLIALEIYAVGLYWLFLGKGIMVLIKLGLLLLIPLFWEARVALLLLVVGIASVGSHMPARYRHYSVLHRRALGPEESLRPVPFSSGPAAAAVAVVEEGRRERR
jgi:membrane protein implicated in regulation of membrane protease activity